MRADRASRRTERETVELAHHLAELGADERSRVYHLSWWNDRLMNWAMARPAFKTQLFRFVDVFPAMTNSKDVARHIDEYFGDGAPLALRWGGEVTERLPLGHRVEARVARRNIERMARQFIAGVGPEDAVAGLHELWRSGSASTVDLLGEKTVTLADGDRYATRVVELVSAVADAAASWTPNELLERDDLGPLPRVNVSIKPTAMAPHYAPLSWDVGLDEAKQRLRPILRLARDRGAFVHFDMEQYDAKDLTLALFRELLTEAEFAEVEAGMVVQAYLRDSRDDLAEMIAWSAQRPQPITIRLVKGAYWDAETVHSRAAGWPVPTFERKEETDANYERCVRLLHDHHGEVRAAFGSHNLRSLAYAITYARHRGIPDDGYELQMIYGMAEPTHAAVKRLGLRLRVYAPVGELVPGMAYLVRRLLENTSNESFVRHRFAEGRDLRRLLSPPRVDALPPAPEPVRRPGTDADQASPYEPESVREWRRASQRHTFGEAVSEGPHRFPVDVPALIDGEDFRTAATIASVDPSAPDSVVARSAACGEAEASRAVEAAVRASGEWRRTPARERAQVLFRTAEWLRQRRDEVAAVECFEAGKPWDQADADVCEAIDFCEYYGREILRLDGSAEALVQSPPGEANQLTYQGKGVAAVISPWNFPLAIPTGMSVAALVAGNPTILKPAEQTPLTARYLIEALVASGAPPGVIQFLPGLGEEVGAALVAHPDVAVIAFTGSKDVGMAINQQAAVVPGEANRQPHVKRVVAEMGGKNALIIDADADPDQAVPAAAVSAFSFAGQKCSAASRLIVHEAVYDEMVDRLVDCARELVLGHPRRPEVQVGPVIDEEAHKRILGWLEGDHAGTVRLRRDDVPEQGYFVGPTIVELTDHRDPMAQVEIFGPVLVVLRARDLDDAIAIANDTSYALTGGIFSRSPEAISKASAELRAGNVYVNRAITGAVVGRQPFGGYGLSGVGSKAGGPDYLLQFMDPRVITENTLRQGFVPQE
jgi:RHH-type proline utilization regulon transcriptional repressor/proline dehydrogenase/delta 1-pyrroline-5-carboxylate dehydrogenase